MSDAVLEATGLTKDYGRRRVVDGLDLTVREGEVFGFLGPNGAGKSTTIRMALGLIRPTRGSVRLMGCDVRRERTRALRQVGAQVETPAFYGYLSAWRNLEILSQSTARTAPEELRAALERVRLAGREHDKVRTYSQGMRMRLGIAQALVPKPRFLILDEPTNGLDPQGMKEVRELVHSLAVDDGITVFLSSHLLSEVQQMCTRVAVIHHGRLVVEGPVEELLRESGARRVAVQVDDPARAATVAEAIEGVTVVESTGDGLLVETAPELVPALNAALVGAGIGVAALVPQRRSLEEFFLAVTGDEA